MTEQDEMILITAIEQAVREMGPDKVIEIIEGILEKDLEKYFNKNYKG